LLIVDFRLLIENLCILPEAMCLDNQQSEIGNQ